MSNDAAGFASATDRSVASPNGAFDAGLRPGPFPDQAASLLPGTGEDAGDLLAELIAAAEAVVIEFGPAHWQEAVSAWWRFGKSRHPASLNLGDCLAYATARVAGQPLLAKGDDFAKTDIQLA